MIDFVAYLQHKAQQEANDIEQETCERVTPPSIDNSGKIILTKKVIEEMLQNSPHTRALSGILSDMGDVDIDKVRLERLAKHL